MSMNIEQFIRKYQPFEKDGEIYQFDWTVAREWLEIEQAHKEKKVCTVVEEDGIMYLHSGVDYVNRQFYIITKHALEEELNFEY